MTNNDILRRFRYALDISNTGMIGIFSLSGHEITKEALIDLLKREEEEGYRECGNELLELFLDGIIIKNRGKQETKEGQPAKPGVPLNNNIILKKMRIALDLKEEGMIAIMELAGVTISKSELSALFRDKSHKNYKECGDQFLRNFLNGVTIRHRNSAGEESRLFTQVTKPAVDQ